MVSINLSSRIVHKFLEKYHVKTGMNFSQNQTLPNRIKDCRQKTFEGKERETIKYWGQ